MNETGQLLCCKLDTEFLSNDFQYSLYLVSFQFWPKVETHFNTESGRVKETWLTSGLAQLTLRCLLSIHVRLN